jgi:hypothetical protein
MMYSSQKEMAGSVLVSLAVGATVLVVLFAGFALSANVARAQQVDRSAAENIRPPLEPNGPRSPRPIGYGGPRFPNGPRVPDTDGILNAVRERIAGIFSRLFGGGFGPEQARR